MTIPQSAKKRAKNCKHQNRNDINHRTDIDESL
jgi:hypothetical protein